MYFKLLSIPKLFVTLVVISVFVSGLSIAVVSAGSPVSEATVTEFQAAGDPDPDSDPTTPNGVLDQGATFPPTNLDKATLKRGTDWIQVNINTSGLPPGAYTVWWIVFNNPEGCIDGCDGGDLFNEDAETSVFWATGGVVQNNGIGNFVDRHYVDASRGDPFPRQDIINGGEIDPMVAEIHNVIKYHGPASSDPDELYEQTHTLLGSCNAEANALPDGNCFDPQGLAFPLP